MSVYRSLQKTMLQNDEKRLSSSDEENGKTPTQSGSGNGEETSLTPTDVGDVYF